MLWLCSSHMFFICMLSAGDHLFTCDLVRTELPTEFALKPLQFRNAISPERIPSWEQHICLHQFESTFSVINIKLATYAFDYVNIFGQSFTLCSASVSTSQQTLRTTLFTLHTNQKNIHTHTQWQTPASVTKTLWFALFSQARQIPLRTNQRVFGRKTERRDWEEERNSLPPHLFISSLPFRWTNDNESEGSNSRREEKLFQKTVHI